MTTITSWLVALAAVFGVLLAGDPAQAQLMRTFVSAGSGSDGNDCNRATPCRTFQGAHDKTLPDGQITVLDAGHYGTVTITKSISIVNDGVGEAGIVASDNTGVTINAPADAHVNLRGITVQGSATAGSTGLLFSSGAALTITKSVFRNHRGTGIIVAPSAGTASVAISDTLVADNGLFGVGIAPTGGAVNAVLQRVGIYNNSMNGLDVTAAPGVPVNVTAVDTAAVGNQHGFLGAGALTRLMLTRCVSAYNRGIGIVFARSVTVFVARSTVTGNANTVGGNDGGFLRSFGDNYVFANGDGDPFPQPIARK